MEDLAGLGDLVDLEDTTGAGDTTGGEDLSALLQSLEVSGYLNAEDIEGDALSFAIVEQPLHGTVVLTDAATGAFTYVPDHTFSMMDQFTFKANDGALDSTPGFVAMTLFDGAEMLNAPPMGSVTVRGTMAPDAVLTARHTLVDDDGLGEIFYAWQVSPDGTSDWTDIPNANATTFTLTASETEKYVRVMASYTDGKLVLENVASRVTVPVMSVDTTQEAFVHTTHTVLEDVSHTMTDKAFDFSGVDGNSSTFQVKILDLPQSGQGHLELSHVILEAETVVGMSDLQNGNLRFMPEVDGNGADYASISVQVGGAGMFSDPSFLVTFDVMPINDAPVAQDASLALLEDILSMPSDLDTLDVSGQLNAEDVDGDVLTFQIVNEPAYGTVVLTDAATGLFTYTPDAAFSLQDQFTYKVNDGELDSDMATITIQLISDDFTLPDFGLTARSDTSKGAAATDPSDPSVSEVVVSGRMLTTSAAGYAQVKYDPVVAVDEPLPHVSETLEQALTFDFRAKTLDNTSVAGDVDRDIHTGSGPSEEAGDGLSFDFSATGSSVVYAPVEGGDESGHPVATSVGGGGDDSGYPASSPAVASLNWDNAFSPLDLSQEIATTQAAMASLRDIWDNPIPDAISELPSSASEEEGAHGWHFHAQSVVMG